jgi:hypothetical protein
MTASQNSSYAGATLPAFSTGVFLAKYNSSGTYQYGTHVDYNGAAPGQAGGVACDSLNNVYLLGSWRNNSPALYNMLVNPHSSSTGYYLPNPGGTYFCSGIIKFNSSGLYQYSTALLHASSSAYAFGVTCDSFNNVIWTGFYGKNPILYNMTQNPNTVSTGYTLPNTGDGLGFVIQYSSSGTYGTSTSLRADAFQGCGFDLASDSSGNVYFAGYYNRNPILYNPTANPNTVSTGYSLPAAGSSGKPTFLKYIFGVSSLSMTLPNLGAGVTSIVEKPIYVKSGVPTTITENSNVFTVPASANVAMATWTTDRWIVTYS